MQIFIKKSVPLFTIMALVIISCTSNRIAQKANEPDPDFYLFLLAGQSNMAGRGHIDSLSSIIDPRIMMLNKNNEWESAKDPVHYDKPEAGVGPGINFSKELLAYLGNKNIRIGLIPAAVGGTSIDKWVPGAIDSTTGTHPYDDAVARTRIAMKRGVLKGILWHQGSSDSNPTKREGYMAKQIALIGAFRKEFDLPSLPFIAGELAYMNENKKAFNVMLKDLTSVVTNTKVIGAEGLTTNADSIHFNTMSARILGKRYAEAMMSMIR